jgi:nucleoside-diphosphate-sugar epimerase
MILTVKVLVAGCGWLGRSVVRALVARGDRPIALRRDPASAGRLEEIGAVPLVADLSRPEAVEQLPGDVDAVVACLAPTGARGAEAYERTYIGAVRTLLDAYAPRGLRSFVYTSSTGVFGQTDGRQVDEHTPPQPASETAHVLVRAERQVLTRLGGHALPASVVRLSGLYGPGRFGVIDRVRSGRLALGPGDGAWMNFCHRTDATRAVVAALDRGRAGEIYHASDACPVRRRDLIRWVAEQFGFDPSRSDAGEGGSGGANRRVDASWSRERLGIDLAYPSFREGLGQAPTGPS